MRTSGQFVSIEAMMRSETPLQETLGQFAEHLQEYDVIRQAWNSYLSDADKYRQVLAEIDLEQPIYRHERDLAYSALGLYVSQVKFDEAQNQLNLFEDACIGQTTDATLVLRNKRMTVSAIDPNIHQVGTLRDKNNELNGYSKYNARRTGRLLWLDLNPQTGGAIALTGRLGKVHIASPLVAKNSYTPAFDIIKK